MVHSCVTLQAASRQVRGARPERSKKKIERAGVVSHHWLVFHRLASAALSPRSRLRLISNERDDGIAPGCRSEDWQTMKLRLVRGTAACISSA
jgi:hypothetical protein